MGPHENGCDKKRGKSTCQKKGSTGPVLECAHCNLAFHVGCLGSKQRTSEPTGATSGSGVEKELWACPECRRDYYGGSLRRTDLPANHYKFSDADRPDFFS